MLKFITVVVAMIACVAAAPGYASLGHGPILGGYGSAYSHSIAAPISYAAPIAKIAAPAYAPLGGHLGLGYGSHIAAAPIGLGAHGYGLGLGGHGLALGGHGLALGGHGLGHPIW